MTHLSERQIEVASLVAEGLSTKRIASTLGLSPFTVRDHIVRIGRRLPGDGPPRWRIIAWYIREHSRHSAA